MKITHAIALVLVSASAASAQMVPPALMVEENGRHVPLGLAKLQTEVRIYGSAAETTCSMTFSNPTARPMEGDLYFPLPEGSTISGYALDVNGQMIDGVAVGKHEARRIYEEVVRHGIDPGLVQWTAGNNFQTRVFPIPAHGTRTIRVSYVSELTGGKEAPTYLLPLKFKDKVGEFSLRVEVVKPAAEPKVTKGELANFNFAKWHESYVAETKQQDWLPVEDLVISLPKTEGPRVLVEQADDGQYYFAIEDYPSVPKDVAPTAHPKHAVVFWDASGSRGGDHGREIAILQKYLTSMLPGGGKMAVDLVLFRNAAAAPVHIEISKSDTAALAAALNSVQYDGGTQLGAIGPIPGAEKPDLYLLFTDGISNFGRETPPVFDAPLYVFSADASANHALLHSLAESNGGQYYNLANWKDADILAQAGRPVWSFLEATAHQGTGVEHDVYPREPQPVGGRLMIAGKMAEGMVDVTVAYGFPSDEHGKSAVHSKVETANAPHGTLLRRLWAQKKLAQLMIHQKENEKEITALGKQYNLVTPYTSLLVLDTIEQYVQYEIAPPKSLPTMRDEYMRRVDTVEHQKAKEKADKIEEVLRMWDDRVKWWTAEYKYAKDFKYKGEQQGQGGPSGGAFGFSSNAAPAAAMPAPAPLGGRSAGLESPAPAAPPPATVAPRGGERGDSAAAESPAPAADAAPAREMEMSRAAPHTANRPALTGAMHSRAPAAHGAGRDAAADHYEQIGGEGKKDEKADEADDRRSDPGIVIKPWQPDMPYLKELQAAKKDDRVSVYMKNRAKFGDSPAFFLDCADFFREAGDNDMSLRVLSNIAELQIEEVSLLRVLGHRLEQIGQLDLAVQTFEQVLDLRPEEPQSYRDLALALAHRAEVAVRPAAMNRDDYTRAVDLLSQVVMRRWDGRFPEIEVIALEEVNRMIPRAKAAGVTVIPLDARLVKLLDFDVRIVMTWHADNTDIDLWVTEPSGEKAFYQHNRTTIGGLVSRDFTQGYGPEEYLVRRAAHGVYKVEANYFGTRATRLLGPVTVQVDVYTNYGRPNEQRKSLTLRLKDQQQTAEIGKIEF